MEDWVDLPVGRNVEVQGHVRYHFLDLKWSSSFHLEFFGSSHMEICHFQPHLIFYLPGSKFGHDSFFHLLALSQADNGSASCFSKLGRKVLPNGG